MDSFSAVSLKCGDKNSESNPSIKTSLLKANGYVCDALEGSDVKLQWVLSFF